MSLKIQGFKKNGNLMLMADNGDNAGETPVQSLSEEPLTMIRELNAIGKIGF